MDELINKIKALADVREHVSGKELSSFKSGGEVRYLISPTSLTGLAETLNLLDGAGVKRTVLGNGTNTLIADCGFDGAVVSLRKLNSVLVQGNTVYAGSGASLSKVAAAARKKGLEGIVELQGIPGTVGGAAVMNAGAYGVEIGDKIVEIEVLHGGIIKKVPKTLLNFGYRSSNILQLGIVTGVTLLLDEGDEIELAKNAERLKILRKNTQPQAPSLGSVFKRINGVSPAVYIDALGLKGKRIGGAEVSRKHANFIVNAGGATTADYLSLVGGVRTAVYEAYGLTLEKEVGLIGE